MAGKIANLLSTGVNISESNLEFLVHSIEDSDNSNNNNSDGNNTDSINNKSLSLD